MKAIIYFTNTDSFLPISNYLHVGNWTLKQDKTPYNFPREIALIEFITLTLKRFGITDFVWVGSSSIQKLQALSKSAQYQFNVTITILQADNFSTLINTFSNIDLLFYPGTLITNLDMNLYFKYHASHNSFCSLLIRRGIKYRVGVAQLNEQNKVTEFIEKPLDNSSYSYTGIFCLRKGWKNLWNYDDKQFLQKSHFDEYLINFISHLLTKKEVRVYLPNLENTESEWWENLDSLEKWIAFNT